MIVIEMLIVSRLKPIIIPRSMIIEDIIVLMEKLRQPVLIVLMIVEQAVQPGLYQMEG